MPASRRSILAATGAGLASLGQATTTSRSARTHHASVTDKVIAEITQRSADERGPMRGYRHISRIDPARGRFHADVSVRRYAHTRLGPDGPALEAIGGLRNGTFEQELVQSYTSADLVVLAIIERCHVEAGGLPAQDGRCASPWFFAVRGLNGGWRIGMLTRLSGVSP